MADMDNFSEINQNFDTIKTLLNSIRAQGILNTSDVDKLLTGINTKLEKINTEEDIDLIKIFLSELKQNLEERHSMLISKFGAIESLFSNLLKNSSEMPKSADIKELFDIVATNLSVFSREVVSQKDTLTDIALRLDALRSDDSQKKDIIKNIALLRPDLERLNNGFDSIVISLNDNFKTIIKTITTIDKTEYLDKFADNLNSIEMSSNTILSALQVVDKKTEQVENVLKDVVKKEDLASTNQRLFELNAQNREISTYVTDISDKFLRIESLTDKIDASVNIIAGLKSVLLESGESKTSSIIEHLIKLENEVKEVSSDTKFENFKQSLENLLENIINNSNLLDKNIQVSISEIQKINTLLSSLDINLGFQNMISEMDSLESNVKNSINEASQKISTLQDVNVTRILNDISNEADSLGSKLNQTQSAIALLCEKNFGSVFENIVDLKKLVTQLDENSISANNAIFSSITDRLTVFENDLRSSLNIQEQNVENSSKQLAEQIETIKNLSSVIDYKMDSSVVEVGNIKRSFSELKTSIDDVLALDFVNTVKDLRIDLYASKQELQNTFETVSNDLSENIVNDLYHKYELIISKLDSTELEIQKSQANSLLDLKNVLEKISNSVIDVLSYVSETKNADNEQLDLKIAEISSILKDNSIDYVETVRDIVDVIKIQVEDNLKLLEIDNAKNYDLIKDVVLENSEGIKKELKFSYAKLLELQDSYKELRESINLDKATTIKSFENVLDKTDCIKEDFENQISLLKANLLEKFSEFKQELTFENNDSINEIKFAVENSGNKGLKEISSVVSDIKLHANLLSQEIKNNNEESLKSLLEDLSSIKLLIDSINSNIELENRNNKNELIEKFNLVSDLINIKNNERINDVNIKYENIQENFNSLTILINNIEKELSNTTININNKHEEAINSLKILLHDFEQKAVNDRNLKQDVIKDILNKLTMSLSDFEKHSLNDRELKFVKIMDSFTALKDLITSSKDDSMAALTEKMESISNVFDDLKHTLTNFDENIDADLTRQMSIIESNFEALVSQITILFDKSDKQLSDKVSVEFENISDKIQSSIAFKLEEYKLKIEDAFDNFNKYTTESSKDIQERFFELNSVLSNYSEDQIAKNQEILEDLIENIKQIIDENVKLTAVDYVSLKNKLVELAKNIELNNHNLSSILIEKFDLISENVNSEFEKISQDVNLAVDNTISSNLEMSSTISGAIDLLREDFNAQSASIESSLSKDSYIAQMIEGNAVLLEDATVKFSESQVLFSNKLDFTNEIIKNIELNTSNTFNAVDSIKTDLSEISQSLLLSKEMITELDNSFTKDFNTLNATVQSISDKEQSALSVMAENLNNNIATEFNSLNNNIQALSEKELNSISQCLQDVCKQFDIQKQQLELNKVQISDFIKKELNALNSNIEKETDVIITELIEQFDILKKSQNDETIKITSQIEDTINSQIYNNIEDLKAYLDVKTDNSVLTLKLDNLKSEMVESVSDIMTNISKLLETGVFVSAFGDFKVANELLINTSMENLNKKFDSFVDENTNTLQHNLKLFNKSFIDAITDKFEELKIISNQCNTSFEEIQKALNGVFEQVNKAKTSISEKFDALALEIKDTIKTTNDDIKTLNASFESLRSQISNKSFDEAFQASINKQVASLENLIREQLSYIEDINELCSNNLPDVTELNTLVKHSILESINQFSLKLDDNDIEQQLEVLKSDIVTQILNVFNQISFVAEQEEILDFIQEKHDELISVLSHIVTNTSSGIDSIKNEIKNLNKKITSIISSEGDVDYIYSLHDLESDIANLRLVLNEMKENGHGQELAELINSTNEIYKLVEAIPNKSDFESMAEDIVSISTRTNKLILASDESYKTLHDNLQDFKLVINDLDERTRNFAQESGMDRIDSKLNAINSMMVNGAKTNQVFNQVFEYLAEWVDNAGVQINAISDKVETLSEIGQIKDMLIDLKAGAEDNTESEELVEALGTVFEKQAKRISALETKLDRIIVETTINNQNNKLDMSPLEDTLNRFLAAMDEKISAQQVKINSLEAKLEDVVQILEDKDTATLTKKVGGMDRQIAKLNKSIEKIASHVVEK